VTRIRGKWAGGSENGFAAGAAAGENCRSVEGITRLTARQRDALECDGCLLVRSLLGKAVVGRMRSRLMELVTQTVEAWDADPAAPVEEGGVVHAMLDLADPDYAPCHEHPLLADAATAVLGPGWRLSGLSLRAPLPGCGQQGLHPDFEHRSFSGPGQTLSAMWCVSRFTRDNGPLRVIPGSHRVDERPYEVLAFGSGMGPHPAEVRFVAPAGSVILFNSADLWHSGTFNYSPEPRLAVTAGFSPARQPGSA
jgi:Phytanoyl-CoA dioxygenase (PhyH)